MIFLKISNRMNNIIHLKSKRCHHRCELQEQCDKYYRQSGISICFRFFKRKLHYYDFSKNIK